MLILQYYPKPFWDDQPCYIQMLVEKIDLRSLFEPICEKYNIPIATAKGWASIRQRKEIVSRYQEYERQSKTPVLLYCGDLDPSGKLISDNIKSNLDSLCRATGWRPTNLVIDRFGLNKDFVDENELTWIDNLETGSGKNLSYPKHRDHFKPYVQDYIKEIGIRKCEANTLVVAPEMGRQLCQSAIDEYISAAAAQEHGKYIKREQNKAKVQMEKLIANMK